MGRIIFVVRYTHSHYEEEDGYLEKFMIWNSFKRIRNNAEWSVSEWWIFPCKEKAKSTIRNSKANNNNYLEYSIKIEK